MNVRTINVHYSSCYFFFRCDPSKGILICFFFLFYFSSRAKCLTKPSCSTHCCVRRCVWLRYEAARKKKKKKMQQREKDPANKVVRFFFKSSSSKKYKKKKKSRPQNIDLKPLSFAIVRSGFGAARKTMNREILCILLHNVFIVVVMIIFCFLLSFRVFHCWCCVRFACRRRLPLRAADTTNASCHKSFPLLTLRIVREHTQPQVLLNVQNKTICRILLYI